MNSYITLKAGNNPSPLKLSILSPNWVPRIARPQWHDYSCGGLLISQYGPTTPMFFECLAKVWNPPPVGYASISDIDTWAKATTQANIDLLLVDHDSVTHNVRMVGEIAFPPINAMKSYYTVALVFQKRS
jgi:hypothetical protein